MYVVLKIHCYPRYVFQADVQSLFSEAALCLFPVFSLVPYLYASFVGSLPGLYLDDFLFEFDNFYDL